jgi:hypothetical protein
MRHARSLRRVCGVILAGCTVGLAGCTHNHYYGNAVPVCGPVTTVPGSVASGSICEVPTQVGGGTLIGSGQGRSTIVADAPFYSGSRAPRVVVSEPSGGSRLGRWHRADPEAGLAQTRVEGEYTDSTTNR